MEKKEIHCPCCRLPGLSIDDFYKVESRKSGHSSYCKECTKDKRKKQAKTEGDKERTRKYRAKYYANHSQHELELSKKWKKENSDRWNKYQAGYKKSIITLQKEVEDETTN